jgi:hypothetical protein
LVFSLVASHPQWASSGRWELSRYFNYVSLLALFLGLKFAVIYWVGYLLGKTYLFEEILFQSFVFEKVAGILLFPFVVVSIYSTINQEITLAITLIFFLCIMALKWGRMLYLSFFKATFSKTHIIVYLCIFEILPFLIFVFQVY